MAENKKITPIKAIRTKTIKKTTKKAFKKTVATSVLIGETPYKTTETCNGTVYFRFLFREISEELNIPITDLSRRANIQTSLIYFILSEKVEYADRLPRVDVLIKILAAINSFAKEKKMKPYSFQDLIEIRRIG